MELCLTRLVKCKKQCYSFLLFIIVVLSGCEQRPSGNTPEYFEAHGIIKGEENHISVGDTVFKVPKDIPFNIYTLGDIVPGKVDVLTLYLDFSYLIDHYKGGGIFAPWMVRVEIEKNLYEYPKTSDYHLQVDNWSKIFYNSDLNLTEFHEKAFRGGWGYISYQAKMDQIVTPLGGPVQFECSGDPAGEIDSCSGGYQHPKGFFVSYYISNRIMPFWQEIHGSVVSTVNSLIVK